MAAPEIKLTKRHIQAIIGVFFVLGILALMLFSYPWLQLQLAKSMMSSGNYQQAEEVLSRLVESRPSWTAPRSRLVISQLQLGKSREAASTVISLADDSRLDNVELAVIYMDVAEQMVNTGHGEYALELTHRLLSERNDAMLQQAAVEITFMIADLYDLPLAMDALELGLRYVGDNWILTRKAFNLLLNMSIGAPPELGEPAVDMALEIFPNNVIAVTQKATLMGENQGPKAALDFLVEKEKILQESTQEYLTTKRNLVNRLAVINPGANLNQYVAGIPDEMLVEMAMNGLNQSRNHGLAGTNFYNIASFDPNVTFRYGQNLYAMERWSEARNIFTGLRELDPEYINFQAVFAAISAKTDTNVLKLDSRDFGADLAKLSPNGNWLAWRRWARQWDEESNSGSELILYNLASSRQVSLGRADRFEWAPSGRFLAYQSLTDRGLGRLHIYNLDDGAIYSLSDDFDVITFNWSGEILFIQAEYQDEIRLLTYTPIDGLEEETIPWEFTGGVNYDLNWVNHDGKILYIERPDQRPREFSFEYDIQGYDWSPNGRLLIIDDIRGNHWLYQHPQGTRTQVNLPGRFAAWGGQQEIYWYLPVWDKLYVLVRLDSNGRIQQYLPYTVTNRHHTVSVSAGARNIVLDQDSDLVIYSR